MTEMIKEGWSTFKTLWKEILPYAAVISLLMTLLELLGNSPAIILVSLVAGFLYTAFILGAGYKKNVKEGMEYSKQLIIPLLIATLLNFVIYLIVLLPLAVIVFFIVGSTFMPVISTPVPLEVLGIVGALLFLLLIYISVKLFPLYGYTTFMLNGVEAFRKSLRTPFSKSIKPLVWVFALSLLISIIVIVALLIVALPLALVLMNPLSDLITSFIASIISYLFMQPLITFVYLEGVRRLYEEVNE